MNSKIHILLSKRFLTFIFRVLSKLKILDVLIFFFPIRKVERKKDGINILVLSSHRLNSEIKELSKCKKISILRVSVFWQSFINFLSVLDSQKYPYKDSEVLEIFLTKLKKIKDIRMVISGSFWYRFDIPIGNKFDEIGVPYTIMHKECFKYNLNQHKASIQRFRNNKCNGTYYLLHNDVIKDVLVSDVSADKIDVLGNLRMDNIFENKKRKGNELSFFLFSIFIGLEDWVLDSEVKRNFKGGWRNLFKNTTKIVLKFAEENQNIKINIKGKHSGEINYLNKVCNELGYNNLNKIKNLNVSINEAAKDIILRSKLIISFASTVILEAAILNKNIIIPNFDECLRPEYKKRIKLINDYNLFNLANSEHQLYELIKKNFSSKVYKKKNNKAQMRKLFKKWVDPLDGQTKERYYNKLIEISKKSLDH